MIGALSGRLEGILDDDDLDDDSRYPLSIAGFDWASEFDITNIGNINRRDIFRPFTLYVQEHFILEEGDYEDDLLYQWIQNDENCEEPRRGPHDFYRLAEICGRTSFHSLFSSRKGEELQGLPIRHAAVLIT